MELNQFTDYSLRTLIYVALKGDELSSVKEIAKAYSISENHLVKVVHKLSRLGYLNTFRGRGGGIAIAMPPEEINLGQVVRAVEPVALLECFPGKETCCPIKGVCGLQAVVMKAMRAFLGELDKVTIADVTRNRGELLARLVHQPDAVH